jgi:hypothetical protein
MAKPAFSDSGETNISRKDIPRHARTADLSSNPDTQNHIPYLQVELLRPAGLFS